MITVIAYKEGHTGRDKSHISTTSHRDLKSGHPNPSQEPFRSLNSIDVSPSCCKAATSCVLMRKSSADGCSRMSLDIR